MLKLSEPALRTNTNNYYRISFWHVLLEGLEDKGFGEQHIYSTTHAFIRLSSLHVNNFNSFSNSATCNNAGVVGVVIVFS